MPSRLTLPSLVKWSSSFRLTSSIKLPRTTLANQNMAEEALSKLKIQNPQEMTAVEIYPGLGVWTSALRDQGFSRILALEPQAKYLKWMKEHLEDQEKGVEVLKMDGYDWQSYIDLKDPKYLGNLIDQDWSKVHPKILFTGTLPKEHKGEQLLAQFASCITNRMAMHSMGRVQVALWLPDQLYKKFVAPPGSIGRCKMSVVIDACADVSLVHSTKPDDFYPNTSEYHLVHVVPFAQKKLTAQWDVFEYVLKHLFVMQRQPLSKMIKTLGPGAEILLGRLSFDPKISVGSMTTEQIDEVAVKFDQWPLRPRVLFEDDF